MPDGSMLRVGAAAHRHQRHLGHALKAQNVGRQCSF
jgi:hypothetical protein